MPLSMFLSDVAIYKGEVELLFFLAFPAHTILSLLSVAEAVSV